MYIESVLKGYKLLPVPPDEQFRKELQEIDHEKLKQMLYSYNPQLHNTTDLTSKKRTIRAIEIAKHYKENPQEELEFPVIRPLIFGIKFERSLQRERITIRLKQRLEEGMIEEVKNLINEGIPVDDLIYYGLEYKFVSLYITGKLSYEAMFQQLNTAIHQFAKRQMTWFRKMEREGFQIHWLEGSLPLESKLEKAHQLLGIEK
jgi:tRNA dimethylallyltransferase